MSIEKQIDVLIKGRTLLLKLVSNYSLEQINQVPKGFNNNIGWNVAHLVVTQQLLCYKLSGLDTLVSNEMIDRYKKGTIPGAHRIDAKEWELIKKMFLEFPIILKKDYQKGVFKHYNTYETSVDVKLDNIDKAIDFNNFHEGIHLGVVLCLRKLV